MTPTELSKLHHAAFSKDRPWKAEEFESLLDNPFVTIFKQPHGFALTRTIADESELLTIAVAPDHQRQGIAQALLRQWLLKLSGTATEAFLEVAADNLAACALYDQFGFREIAKRTGYYTRNSGPNVDALILRHKLTLG